MFGKSFSSMAMRASRAYGHHATRVCSSAAAGAAALGPFLGSAKGTVLRVGSAMLLGGGASMALSNAGAEKEQLQLATSSVPWVQEIEAQESMQEVLSAGQMLRKHPVAKIVVDQDCLFEGMINSGQIVEFRCFYDRSKKEFHSIVMLGRDVCGFPQTVHGGLTAAIVDETLGGLGVCMWRAGALGFRPPAYTARLEVDYKQKIPAGSVIKCTTKVERIDDRKIWMTGQVTDGAGVVYASARALFVAPRMRNVLLGWIPGVARKQQTALLLPPTPSKQEALLLLGWIPGVARKQQTALLLLSHTPSKSKLQGSAAAPAYTLQVARKQEALLLLLPYTPSKATKRSSCLLHMKPNSTLQLPST